MSIPTKIAIVLTIILLGGGTLFLLGALVYSAIEYGAAGITFAAIWGIAILIIIFMLWGFGLDIKGDER